MRKIHIALSTRDLQTSVKEYSARLRCEPCSLVADEYALRRTESINLSLRNDPNCSAGELRHLGWEDSDAQEFSKESDVNGIVWENFSASHQADEINNIWPNAQYKPVD